MRSVELRPGSRVPLYAVLALCFVACIGQGIAYFAGDSDDQLNVGIFFVIITTGLAGITSSLAGYPLARQLDDVVSDGPGSATQLRLQKQELYRGLKFCLTGVGVELVVGEILALIALATGASDPSVLLGALLVGGLGAAFCILLGWATGLLVLWPLISLIGILRLRISGKPFNEGVGGISAISLTVIAFAITGVLGIGSAGDEVVGTPQGRGLAQMVILFIRYGGTPSEQVLSWVARALAVAILLEVLWLRHIYRLRKSGSAVSPLPERSRG